MVGGPAIFGNANFITCLQGPLAIIVVFKIAGAKLFVETANGLVDLAPQEHGKTGHTLGFAELARKMPGPLFCHRVDLGNIPGIIIEIELLSAADAIGAGADNPQAGMLFKMGMHVFQPMGGDNHIVIEQK